jgi:hypothetical protein
MKQHFYSAKEILQILDKAREVGITTIRIPGFEAEWRIPVTPGPGAEKSQAKAKVEQGVKPVAPKKCVACSRELSANQKVGDLCVPCYRSRHTIPESEYGDCSQCGEGLKLGRVSNEPYCQACWARERDGGR